jgi:allantoin racemase
MGTDAFDEHFRKVLESAARPETEVEVTSFQPIGGNLINVDFYIGEIVRAVIKAEKSKHDAVIIGCADDPGLMESRSAVNIPVVAPAEAALHAASMLGRFCAIPILAPKHPTYIQDLARRYGLAHMLASIKVLDVGRPANENEIASQDPKKHRHIVLDLFRKAMVDTVPQLARSAVTEEHARAIIFGCTFFSGWARERKAISEELKVPVMDPVIVSLKVAEMHIDNLSR